jgi:hypothetical protein
VCGFPKNCLSIFLPSCIVYIVSRCPHALVPFLRSFFYDKSVWMEILIILISRSTNAICPGWYWSFALWRLEPSAAIDTCLRDNRCSRPAPDCFGLCLPMDS